MAPREVIVVSHGFQISYERGFCNALAENGVKLVLISSDRTDYPRLHPGVPTVNLRGSQDEGRPVLCKLLNLARYHARLIAFVARNKGSVIHVIGLAHPPLLCGVIEGLWFRLCGRRYLLTVHNLLPHDRHTAWMRFMSFLTYRFAHGLVVHTQAMREELSSKHGIAIGDVHVMEHGLEADVAEPGKHSQCDGLGTLRLLFFGTIARYKGLDLLLEALKEIDFPFSLTIAGTSIDATIQRDIRRRIAGHPAANAIHWRDAFIPEAELSALFAGADALVLPYRHIGQSGVLFQALRFGVPVVATRVGSFAQYVTHEIGEICPPHDIHGLAAALRHLQGRLSRISRRRIAEVGSAYRWPLTVRALVPAYA